MRDSVRLFATMVIWIAFMAVSGTLLTSPTGAVASANGAALLGIMAILAIAATTITYSVWHSGFKRNEQLPVAKTKRKRTDRKRIERLVESLDDDEIYDLETLLLAREDKAGHHSS